MGVYYFIGQENVGVGWSQIGIYLSHVLEKHFKKREFQNKKNTNQCCQWLLYCDILLTPTGTAIINNHNNNPSFR